MYRTGPFTDAFREVGKYGGGLTRRYMRPGRSTVSLGGNSGGPLWVRDSRGAWGQAGVFVSGSAGVTSLDSSAWNIIVQAINNTGSTPPPPPPPPDDHSNSRSGATFLTLGSSRGGVLERGGDVDYFRFTAPSTGDFVITSTGATDVFGSLYSSGGALIVENDDSGVDRNFRISRRLSAGTYYVRVRGYSTSTTGSYSVRATQTSSVAPEIEITGRSSRVVQDGDTVASSTDGTHFGSSNVGSSVVRSFTVRNRGNATLSLSGSPRVVIGGSGAASFSVTQQPSSSVGGGSSSVFSIRFQPVSGGTHHAMVSISNNDSNENPYNFAIAGVGNGAVNDDHGGSFTTATALGGNRQAQGQLNFGGDEDYFSFTVPQDAQYTIESKGSTDTYGYLYRSSRSLLIQDDDSGDGLNFRFVRQLSPGTYYIRVRGYSTATLGNYTLEIRSSRPEPEINVTGPGLTLVPDGASSASVANGTEFGSLLHDTGHVERTFRIENFGAATLILSGSPRVQISGAGASQFRVMSQPSGTVSSGRYTSFRVRYQPIIPGVHTATVTINNNDYGENPYDFVIRGTATGALDDHGDTRATSTSVGLPSTSNGVLERGGDFDMFRFQVAQSRTVTLRTTGTTDTYGRLLDSREDESSRTTIRGEN